MNENTNTATTEPVEAPKRKGNPNWVKGMKSPAVVVRASVTGESRPKRDANYVENPNPDLVYKWGRKSAEHEMQVFADRGYVPATGNEKIAGNPFEASKDTTGQTKERGDRILMCCPRELVEARQRDRAGRHLNVKDAAASDARQMSNRNAIVMVEDSSEKTVRESLKEE